MYIYIIITLPLLYFRFGRKTLNREKGKKGIRELGN